METFDFFFVILDHNYKLNAKDYPLISSVDIQSFKDRMTSFRNHGFGDIGSDVLYDPIMEPLVQSSLAHLLYMKKHNIPLKENDNGDKLPDLMAFHPNYIRFAFLDSLVSNKASVTLDSIKLFLFSPSTACMNREKLMLKVNELLRNMAIVLLVDHYFVHELLVGDDPLKKLDLVKTTRGLLYLRLMELYLEHIDLLVLSTIKKSGLSCFWVRCLNTAILGFTDKRTVPKFTKI